MGSEEQQPYSRHQQVKNVPIKVTLFNKQNMIWDMFADILNSENQQWLCNRKCLSTHWPLLPFKDAF